jgi:hypothetical protein
MGRKPEMILFPRAAWTTYAAWRNLGEKQIESLALIDSLNPAWSRTLSRSAAAAARLAQLREKARYHSDRIRAVDTASRFHYVSDRTAAFLRSHGESAGALLGLTSPRAQNRRLAFRHTPKAVAASAIVIRLRGRRPHAPGLGWAETFRGGVTTIDLPFAPYGALTAGTVGRVAAILCDAPRDGT